MVEYGIFGSLQSKTPVSSSERGCSGGVKKTPAFTAQGKSNAE
jgi:hypothetical protein